MLKLDIGLDPTEALQLILAGLEAKRAAIEANMADIRAQLSGAPAQAAAPAPTVRSTRSQAPAKTGRRELSTEARARIAKAQKKRWKNHHRQLAAEAAAPPKRKPGRPRINLTDPSDQPTE